MFELERIQGRTASERKVEIVERKGKGHPDHLSDSIVEKFSNKLYKNYLKKFGRPLHYNVDKLQAIGGRTTPKIGGGEVKEPIDIIFSGRATSKANGKQINIKRIAKESAREILSEVRYLDQDKHVNYLIKTREGSSMLKESVENPKANDTSFGVGYWPLSELENLTLGLEKYMNSKEFKRKYPFTGEDIKVMGTRRKDKITLTVAVAFIDKLISSYEDYFYKKEKVKEAIKEHVKKDVRIRINTLDNKEENQAYLTVTGTSLECGDDGAVGRGNRVNGLITPCRPMSLEATAGKNPVSHTGKLYNALALKIAKRIYKETDVDFCSVKLLSQIGKPINNPHVTSISYKGSANESKLKEVYNGTLKKIPELREEITKEKIRLF